MAKETGNRHYVPQGHRNRKEFRTKKTVKNETKTKKG